MSEFDFDGEFLNSLFDKLNSRIDDLEATVEELRYAGPVTAPLREDDYDYYTDGEWDAM